MRSCNKTHFLVRCDGTCGFDGFCTGKKEKTSKYLLPGMTLIELVISMAIALIVILAAGLLLVAGNRTRRQGFAESQKKIKRDSQAIMLTFGNIARKSNRLNYHLYIQSGSNFIPSAPKSMTDVEVVSGDAVEFRYWDVDLDTADSHHLIDTSKTATAYALFYIDGDQLLVDYGPYPPGAVPEGGGAKNPPDTTLVLADNVSTDGAGFFSHTVQSGVGKGCVRTNVILTDPNDKEEIRVMVGSIMRNIWPR